MVANARPSHIRSITSANFPAGTIALEIEWNNKDPFFDRDLENFKRLHSDGAISSLMASENSGSGARKSSHSLFDIIARAGGLDLSVGGPIRVNGVHRVAPACREI